MNRSTEKGSNQTKDTQSISLFPIFLVTFIGALGYSIILPFLVFLVTKFGGNALIYGVLGSVYPAFQLIGAPILGRWSDLVGRRKVLLLSQGGTLVSWIIFLLALFFPMISLVNVDSSMLGTFVFTLPLLVLFFARALDGITGGNISVANAYLADVTEEKDRSKNFGKMAVSSNLGYILGPALAGILGATVFGEALPVSAALLISLVAVFIIAFNLPESNPCVLNKYLEQANVGKVFGQEHKECYVLKGSEKIKIRDIAKLKNIPYILIVYFLVFLGFNVFYTSFPIHAVQGLDWSITEMGIFFSILSFMMVIVQGPVLSRLAKKCSDGFLTILGSGILGTNFILIMSSNRLIIYCAAALFAIGNGLMWPSVLSILSKLAGNKYQGAIQGFASSAGSLASILGLILGGILYEMLGTTTFLIPAIIIYVVFFLSFRLPRISRQAAEVEQ